MTRLTRLPAPAFCELWLADLNEAPDADAIATLSADERQRAARFAFERDRGRYLSAHCTLRQLLSQRTGVAGEALVYGHGAFGKPHLQSEPACAFNLSHSKDVGAVALADDGEIGVDVELIRPMHDAAQLAQRNYTASEYQALLEAPAADRDLAFLYGWTRKEACLKAIGSGLSIAPETFEAGLDPHDRVVDLRTPEGAVSVRVHSFRHGAHVVGALAQVL